MVEKKWYARILPWLTRGESLWSLANLIKASAWWAILMGALNQKWPAVADFLIYSSIAGAAFLAALLAARGHWFVSNPTPAAPSLDPSRPQWDGEGLISTGPGSESTRWFAGRNKRSEAVTKDPTEALVLARPEGDTNPMPVWRSDGGVAFNTEKDPPFVVLGWSVINASPYVLSTDETVTGHILMGGAPLSRPCVVRRALRNVGYLDKGAFVVHQHFTADEVDWLQERWDRSVAFDPSQLVVSVRSDVHGESFRWRLRPLSVTPSELHA